MNLIQRIDFDVECLTYYFQRLFFLAEETSKLHPPEPDPILIRKQYAVELAKQLITNNISMFIRPNMVGNVYSFLDFRLGELCACLHHNRNLALIYRDIRANNGLDQYHKYLIKIALLDLDSAMPSFKYLDGLRIVRNQFTHSGGHVSDKQRKLFKNISGVTLVGSEIFVSDDFIWDSLNHAQTYLHAVALAMDKLLRANTTNEDE